MMHSLEEHINDARQLHDQFSRLFISNIFEFFSVRILFLCKLPFMTVALFII